MKTFWASAVVVFALFLTGCYSVDYYQDRAVQRAREFLRENAKELTGAELYYAKFHKPVFLVSDVVGGPSVGGQTNLNSEQRQICITWKFPERKEYYMVVGFSSRTMEWWYPQRLVRKSFVKQEGANFKSAVASSRSYATNNLWETMPHRVHNQIRFRDPWVLETNFDLNFNPDGLLTPEELEKEREKAKKQIQITLVWKPESGDWVVFSGYSGERLSGWKILMAGFLTPEDVQKHTVRTLASPGEDGKVHKMAPELLEETEQEKAAAAATGPIPKDNEPAAATKIVPKDNEPAAATKIVPKDNEPAASEKPATAPAK